MSKSRGRAAFQKATVRPAGNSQAAVAAATARRGTLFEQISQTQAQADAARAQLETADLTVESTLLRASKAGRVGDLSVRVGQFVQPGQRLMTVVPVSAIYVTANFKETDNLRVRHELIESSNTSTES